MSASGWKAIILLGHGSRVPEAGENMLLVVEALRRREADTLVEFCYMSRLGPHFPETFEKCVAEGASEITVIPYFLHQGLHIRLDIPEMLKECAEKHPDVGVVLGKCLGYDEALVDLVQKRCHEAVAIEDIRGFELPPRESFPVPPGQFEFVGMPPEEARRWRRAKGEDEHHHHDHA